MEYDKEKDKEVEFKEEQKTFNESKQKPEQPDLRKVEQLEVLDI